MRITCVCGGVRKARSRRNRWRLLHAILDVVPFRPDSQVTYKPPSPVLELATADCGLWDPTVVPCTPLRTETRVDARAQITALKPSALLSRIKHEGKQAAGQYRTHDTHARHAHL